MIIEIVWQQNGSVVQKCIETFCYTISIIIVFHLSIIISLQEKIMESLFGKYWKFCGTARFKVNIRKIFMFLFFCWKQNNLIFVCTQALRWRNYGNSLE